jgi:hypothetical protein
MLRHYQKMAAHMLCDGFGTAQASRLDDMTGWATFSMTSMPSDLLG